MPIPHIHEQIVTGEVIWNKVRAPVCVGDTGFDTRWARQCEVVRVGNRHYEGQVHGYQFTASGPRPNAYVSIAATAEGNNMMPRPYEVVKRREPRALHPNWAQERGPGRQLLRYFGRDQIVNFFEKVAEDRSRPSSTPCRRSGAAQPDTSPAL